MMRWINNCSVGVKLASNVVLMVLGLLLVVAVSLHSSHEQMVNDRKAGVQGVVEVAAGYADALEAEVVAGHLTRDQAIAQFVRLTMPIRYHGEGYFAAYTTAGVYIINPVKPSSIGTNGTDLVDNSGRHFVQDSIAVVKRAGAGFYNLDYPKPGSTTPLPKVNYAKGVPAWDMIIVSGAYIDDLNAASLQQALVQGLIALPILLICLAGSLLVQHSLAGGLRQLAAAMKSLASGDLTVRIPGLQRKDEVGTMAGTVQVFQEGLQRAQSLEAEAAVAAGQARVVQAQTEAERAAIASSQAHVVAALAAGLSKLAEGDLTCAIPDPFDSEYERLRHDFNTTVAQLGDAVAHIVTSTRAITAGAGEITAAADDLSRRSEQQAASLEQTAAALDEITATVRKTASGAQHALKIVSDAHVGAEKSGRVMQDAVSAMGAIEDSAKKVAQIIGVIDEIAFQTNLLALNAGVEAARAGDSGRGFAVVASEVRALAQRSAAAAKEIKALISTSSQQVARGAELVGSTGRSLHEIVAQVGQINSVVGDIAASAHEQASGLAQVNIAVNQMDQVTQQNAAMVEQSTAASHVLESEAVELTRLTGRFRLAADVEGEPAPRHPSNAIQVRRPRAA